MAFLALLCVIALVSPLVFNYETDVIGQNLAIEAAASKRGALVRHR